MPRKIDYTERDRQTDRRTDRTECHNEPHSGRSLAAMMRAIYSYSISVCPSVTHRYCVKTNEQYIMGDCMLASEFVIQKSNT